MYKKQLKIIVWMLELLFIVILISSCPVSLSLEKKNCYYVICVQLTIICIINMCTSSKYSVDIIEPIVLITLIHILIFEITPLICLMTNEIGWFEKDLWGGCIKGSWISTLGYLSVILAYYNSRNYRIIKLTNKIESKPDKINVRCLYFNIIVWLIAFISNLYLIMTSGKSLRYILTLGFGNVTNNVSSTVSVGFLGVIAYSMISSYLYIFELSNNRLVKIILFYLMAVTFMVRGFRFILIAVILSPLIFVCLEKKKRPKIWQLMVISMILLIMIGFLGLARNSIRLGIGISGISLQSLNIKYIYDVVLDNFSIVKTYYGIIEHIPSELGYTFGSQMLLYTLIMLIPRAFWRGKPQPILREIISVSVSKYAASAGTAYPYIGEFYHEFGIIGVIIFSYFFGRLFNILKKYMYCSDIHSKILYASIFPLIFQILIRGYTPSNFYMILFVVLPIVISKRLF